MEDSRTKGPKGDTGQQGPKGDTGPQGTIDTSKSYTFTQPQNFTKINLAGSYTMNNLKGSEFYINTDVDDYVILSTKAGVPGGSHINFNPVFGGNVRIGYNPNDFWSGGGVRDTNVPNAKLAVKGDIYSDGTLISKNINLGNNWMLKTDNNKCLLLNKIENNTDTNVYKICQDSTNTIVPRGTIIAWSGDRNNLPSGWVLCEGQSLVVGGTTIQIPDLRGRFILGGNTDANKLADLGKYDYNAKGGRERALLKHTHSVRGDSNNFLAGGGGWQLATANYYTNYGPGQLSVAGNVEDNNTDTTLPPYYVLAYLYKL